MTSPQEELREAAKKLRELASAASSNWTVDVVGPIGPGAVLAHHVAATNLWRDAVYIAAMKPAVAVALADLFDLMTQTIWTHRQALALARLFVAANEDDSDGPVYARSISGPMSGLVTPPRCRQGHLLSVCECPWRSNEKTGADW